MSATVIRHVSAADVPAVIALVRAVLAEFGIPFGEGSETDKQLDDLPGVYTDAGGAFWVACDDAGVVVGTAGVFPVAPGVLELRKMYVAPAGRGHGIGAALLARAVDFARTAEASALVLDTTDAMRQAIAFYERHGFVRDDAQIRGARCSRGYRLALGG
ncbi:MAG: GNAT family N-acetyltransferase [Deltaproteobacteria bacterium]|nr:GNAT family N-acetyltransferase [Deltaproteobacteria bacterium]